MKTLLLCLLAANLGLASDQSAPARSPTFGKTAETFVGDCEVILFGKEVPKVSEAGKLGYRIVKRSDAVLVNGVVWVSAGDDPSKPVFVDPKIRARSAVRQAAADYLWDLKVKPKDGYVVVAGERHTVGEPFLLSVPGSRDTVEVVITKGGMIRIEYDGSEVGFASERPVPIIVPEAVRIEERLDGRYRGMLGELNPGRLVLIGETYWHTFPLSKAVEVKASLGRIPARAKFISTDPTYGRDYYEPIQDGEFLWTSGVIRDVIGK